jgi:hypothetical protein
VEQAAEAGALPDDGEGADEGDAADEAGEPEA